MINNINGPKLHRLTIIFLVTFSFALCVADHLAMESMEKGENRSFCDISIIVGTPRHQDFIGMERHACNFQCGDQMHSLSHHPHEWLEWAHTKQIIKSTDGVRIGQRVQPASKQMTAGFYYSFLYALRDYPFFRSPSLPRSLFLFGAFSRPFFTHSQCALCLASKCMRTHTRIRVFGYHQIVRQWK